MKIDIHTHILPPNIPNFKGQFGYGGFIQLEHDHSRCCATMIKDDGTRFREVQSNCFDHEPRLKEMDETGVKIQVLSTVPVMFSYWAKDQDGLTISKYLNDHIAETVQKAPDRFMGLGTVPLQNPDFAIEELHRCMKELNLKGVQIGSNINNVNLGDSRFLPFFKEAEKLGASIFVHPWQMMGQEHMPEYWMPWLVGMPAETSRAICSLIFSGTMQKCPQLKIAFAHGGGSFPITVGRIEHGYNVRPDLCAKDNKINPRDYLGRFWIDGLVHDPNALHYIIDLLGEDKICMGSDYPFPLGEHHPGKLIETVIENKAVREKLLFKNALQWLNVKDI
ncbi:MAG: amidohydrolase family protein [Bacteriovoracaceae bacterium]